MYAYADRKQANPEKDKSKAPVRPLPMRTAAPNGTGIPDSMKSHYENLSGFSFEDVRVHYNSDKPAQLQALAYTQGNQVYIGPGQEQHLGHELGHVVQQKQGRVMPTTTINGLAVNDNALLEKQADSYNADHAADYADSKKAEDANTVQLMKGPDDEPVANLEALNTIIVRYGFPAVALANFRAKVPGVTLSMVNNAIASSEFKIVDKFFLHGAIGIICENLVAMVGTAPIVLEYDPHGDKHFPGGPAGTKFTAAKGTVNPQIEERIMGQIARIRRNANGTNKNYYLTTAGIPECGGKDLVVQLSIIYDADGKDRIAYHGYPDDTVTAYSLSLTKAGAEI